jgi:hypothetical protein
MAMAIATAMVMVKAMYRAMAMATTHIFLRRRGE